MTARASRAAQDPLSLAVLLFGAVIAVFLLLALVVAIFLPYGEFDAMAFGTWSRLLAEHWPHLRLPDTAASQYDRPLFYVLQGWLWAAFGFHQSLGRVLSLVFSVLLLGGVAWLAAQSMPAQRRLAAALAALVLVLVVAFDRYIAAGLSDIPVAAMVAVTGALAFSQRAGRARLAAVAGAAALAALTKPSAFPALAGLCVAVLIGRRSELRGRVPTSAAIAAGALIAIVYDLVQALYLKTSLWYFLTVGTGGYYAQLADADRRNVLLDGGWLGADLRIFVIFAIAYALARLGLPHRSAVLVAFPIAAAWSWLGPHLAGAQGARVGIIGTGGWVEQLALLVLAASVLLAVAAPIEATATQLQLLRGLVWALPPFLGWALRAVYDSRLLAPAWPPLVLLIVWSLLPAFAGARARSRLLAFVPAVAATVLGAYAINQINGLGASGWQRLQNGGLAGLTNAAQTQSLALGGDFSAELAALAPLIRPDDVIVTVDQRLRFYYLPQVRFAIPQSCEQLGSARILVLLESDEVRAQYGKRASPSFWTSCPQGLQKVFERPGAFAILVRRPAAI